MSQFKVGVWGGLAAGAFWGLSFLIPRLFPDLSAATLTLARCGGFGLVSLVVLYRQSSFALGRQRAAFLLGFLGYSLYYFLLIHAVRLCGISACSLVIGLLPVSIGIAGKDSVQRVGLFRLSLALIATGIALLNLEGFSPGEGKADPRFFAGIILSFLCLFLWTYFALLNARFLKTHPQVKGGDWAAATGLFALATAPLFVAAELATSGGGDLALWGHGPFLFRFAIAAAILGIGCSFLASLFWNLASQHLPVGLAGQLIVSETLFALLYGFLFDQRWPRPVEWASMSLLITGILIGVSAFQKR